MSSTPFKTLFLLNKTFQKIYKVIAFFGFWQVRRKWKRLLFFKEGVAFRIPLKLMTSLIPFINFY